MVQDSENSEDDHENEWPSGSSNSEKTNQANDRQVAANQGVLQCTRIYETLGVNCRIVDVQQVVSVSKVEEIEANG